MCSAATDYQVGGSWKRSPSEPGWLRGMTFTFGQVKVIKLRLTSDHQSPLNHWGKAITHQVPLSWTFFFSKRKPLSDFYYWLQVWLLSLFLCHSLEWWGLYIRMCPHFASEQLPGPALGLSTPGNLSSSFEWAGTKLDGPSSQPRVWQKMGRYFAQTWKTKSTFYTWAWK